MKDIIRIESISELHEHAGFEKPEHPLVSVINFSDFSLPAADKPLKVVIDLYSVTLKDFPCGLKYGRKVVDFQEGALLCMAPGQVITFEGSHEAGQAAGWGLFFHPDLLRESFSAVNIDMYTFFSYESDEALHLSDQEKENLKSIIAKIKHECSLNIDSYTNELISSNIILLLNYCKRYYGRQFITRSSLNCGIVQDFNRFLKTYTDSGQLKESGVPSVKYCAENMSLSPNYLSDLLKKETGKNTQEHIHYHVMEKAKTLLLNSEKTVSEIAYELGFEYPQYFSKLFKSRTGITPGKYRE